MQITLLVPASKGKERFPLPPLQMALVAAMTPKGHQVEIWDENVKELDLRKIPKLVGLTGMTPAAPRAYQLARLFRDLGSKVVMGGPHATAVPWEVKNYVDSVVLGEAQGLWPKVVEDVEEGNLKPFYYHESPPTQRLPLPRRDLYRHKAYPIHQTLYTSRGCSLECYFCPAQRLSLRPLEEVVEEVKGLRGRRILFLDDNLAASPKRTRELFLALIPLKKRWIGYTSPKIGQGDLLDLAKKSGCQGLFVELYPFSPKEHQRLIKRIHALGIPVVGDFSLGFDGEDQETLGEVLSLIKEEGLAGARFSILTPFPGTPYYRELYREGRIKVYHPSAYSGEDLVFTSSMGEGIIESLKEAREKVYAWPAMVRRFFKGPLGASFFYYQNRNLRGRRT